MVQLILPRPEPMQVQSQIIPSFGRSYVSPTRYDLALYLSKHISSAKWTEAVVLQTFSSLHTYSL